MTNDVSMNTTAVNTGKTLTTFRLNSNLVEKLRILAKNSNRSLNNYVETLLLDVVFHEPNAETIAAIEEARSSKTLEPFDRNELEKLISAL